MAIDTAYVNIAGYQGEYTEYAIELESLDSGGETITARIAANRTGSSAIVTNAEITMRVNGSVVAESTEGLSHDFTISGSGSYGDNVEIEMVAVNWDDASGTLSGTVPEPAKPEFSASCNVPSGSISVDQTAEATATIENTGEADGTATISLIVDGAENDTFDVDVPAGKTVDQPVELSFDGPGDYDIAFEGDGF